MSFCGEGGGARQFILSLKLLAKVSGSCKILAVFQDTATLNFGMFQLKRILPLITQEQEQEGSPKFRDNTRLRCSVANNTIETFIELIALDIRQ